MANLVPVSSDTALPPEPNLKDLIVTALRTRPEVAEFRAAVLSNRVDVAYFHNQTLPQINLNLGVTEQGFAGAPAPLSLNPFFGALGAQVEAINELVARVNSLTPPGVAPLLPIQGLSTALPGYTIGGIGTAYSSMFALRYPQYTIGASIGFPIRNRTAEAQYKIAVEQRNQLMTQEVALIQRLEYEARNALQTYRSARSRLLAATAARKAAEAVSASELRRFKAGESTTFLVLQREINVATQRGAELQAQTDVQKALVEIDRVSGGILANNQVKIDALGAAPPATLAPELSPLTR
jgi:HAE1 family hydrophobic/amphiphilic exporter-1